MGARERSNIVRSLGAGRGAFKREIEAALYPNTAPFMLTRTPFAALDRGLIRSADNGIAAPDLAAFQAGLQEAAGRDNYINLLSMASGGVVFGALSRNLRAGIRLTAGMLDHRGRFLGVSNAGRHSPIFSRWLSRPGRSIEILRDGRVRYTRVENGETISVVYRNGYGDFSPYAHRGLQDGLDIPVLPNRSTSAAQRVADQREASRLLNEMIQDGRISASRFTRAELADIAAGNNTVGAYTWHHGRTNGSMELIRSDVHGWFPHRGWFSH